MIHDVNQRCFIVHGTHNVTLYDNVAVRTFGHCYVLEDGFEMDNVFERNLGAQLKIPSRILQNVAFSIKNDKGPSVFWIMVMNLWQISGASRIEASDNLAGIKSTSIVLKSMFPPHKKKKAAVVEKVKKFVVMKRL